MSIHLAFIQSKFHETYGWGSISYQMWQTSSNPNKSKPLRTISGLVRKSGPGPGNLGPILAFSRVYFFPTSGIRSDDANTDRPEEKTVHILSGENQTKTHPSSPSTHQAAKTPDEKEREACQVQKYKKENNVPKLIS